MILNKPIYFYHFILNDYAEKINVSGGLLTPKYMYDTNKFQLLDPILDKYRRRIINNWNMYGFKDPETLSREEIMDAINIKLGPRTLESINFFRFIPSPELGWKLKDLLSRLRIFRIDINNIDINKIINNRIDWGTDTKLFNRRLNRLYYETVSYNEYVKNYKDNYLYNKLELLEFFNQITIEVKDGVIPLHLCEEVTKDVNLFNKFSQY